MRFSKYNVVAETNNGFVVYNSANSRCVHINKENELSKFKKLQESKEFNIEDEMVKELYQRGFIVDDDIDEFKEVKKRVDAIYEKSRRHLYVMLYVTENCNFRCVYCSERHVDKKFSAENWNSLLKYIEKSFEKDLYDSVKISFFGGEPLLEYRAIINFLDKLVLLTERYSKAAFYTMTTNGYLLTPKVYDQLVERGVFYFQITVDGFEETHDQTRPLAGGGKTWNKIIENLKYINTKKDDCIISFRVNVSPINVDTINNFTAWVYKNFDNKKFELSVNAVSKLTNYVNDKYIKNWREDDMREIMKKTIKMTIKDNFLYTFLSDACHCANLSFYTLSTDGKIAKCEKAQDDGCKYFGYLSKDGEFVLNETMMKAWEKNFETEYCENCVYYPLCGGRRCPEKKLYHPRARIDCLYKKQTPPSDCEVKNKIIRYISAGFS